MSDKGDGAFIIIIAPIKAATSNPLGFTFVGLGFYFILALLYVGAIELVRTTTHVSFQQARETVDHALLIAAKVLFILSPLIFVPFSVRMFRSIGPLPYLLITVIAFVLLSILVAKFDQHVLAQEIARLQNSDPEMEIFAQVGLFFLQDLLRARIIISVFWPAVVLIGAIWLTLFILAAMASIGMFILIVYVAMKLLGA